MDLQTLVLIQITADVVLCTVLIALLVRINRKMKDKPPSPLDPESLEAFRKVLDESQGMGNHFLQELEEHRIALKDLLVTLNEKERSLRDLGDQSRGLLARAATQAADPPEKPYGEAMRMAEAGMPPEEIARRCGLSEGELKLVVGLVQKNHECL